MVIVQVFTQGVSPIKGGVETRSVAAKLRPLEGFR